MHDMSLGAPVNIGCYDGPIVNGKPLHTGDCEDGVYGCRMCNNAMRWMSDELIIKAGWNTHTGCDWCKASTHIRDIYGVRPWDEPSCYYEVCKDCKHKYNQELQAEYEYDRRRYGDDDF